MKNILLKCINLSPRTLYLYCKLSMQLLSMNSTKGLQVSLALGTSRGSRVVVVIFRRGRIVSVTNTYFLHEQQDNILCCLAVPFSDPMLLKSHQFMSSLPLFFMILPFRSKSVCSSEAIVQIPFCNWCQDYKIFRFRCLSVKRVKSWE